MNYDIRQFVKRVKVRVGTWEWTWHMLSLMSTVRDQCVDTILADIDDDDMSSSGRLPKLVKWCRPQKILEVWVPIDRPIRELDDDVPCQHPIVHESDVLVI